MRKLSFAEACASLPRPATDDWPDGVFDAELLRVGAVSLSIFAPRGEDLQTPHEQDEIYLIVTGSGHFVSGGERVGFKAGDAIYVPAGEPHRFEPPLRFAAWVVFFEPSSSPVISRA